MNVEISRRKFLRSLVAVGAVLPLPVSLADATPTQIDKVWDQLNKDPWFFEVGEAGAIVVADVAEPKINADIYDININYLKTTEQLIETVSEYEEIRAHFGSLLLEEIEELQTVIAESEDLHSHDDDDEEGSRESAKKHDADELLRLQNRLKSLEELEYDENWQEWVRLGGEREFPRFKVMLEDFLASDVDWLQMEIWPVYWSSQGQALSFFNGIDNDICKSLGVVIVEGEHPGSTYFGAELHSSIDDANKIAEGLGLPIRFRNQLV